MRGAQGLRRWAALRSDAGEQLRWPQARRHTLPPHPSLPCTAPCLAKGLMKALWLWSCIVCSAERPPCLTLPQRPGPAKPPLASLLFTLSIPPI
jgi:hypothetical protein